MRSMDRREALQILTAAPLAASTLVSCAGAGVERGRRVSAFAMREPPREFRAAWVASVDNID